VGRGEEQRRYSITASARASSVGGTSMPRVRAVCRLMTNSNRVAGITGMSAGFSPLKRRRDEEGGAEAGRRLLDHFVGENKQMLRNVETKPFSSFYIDDEIELCRDSDW
jgi:hypothetical protein